MKKRNNILKFVFFVLLSLTPIFWFFRRPGVLIDGVDTNFPLDPSIWFKRRFFVWTAVSNAGADFSASTAGTFFHLLQFLPYKLGFSLQQVEIFSLLFWFSLIIFSSWFLSRIFFSKKTIPQIVFVVLYSLNIWFFNTWENVKVANLALAAAIPLGFSILILLRERKIKRGSAAFLSILTGIILAGAGINPAYIICFFLILSIYFFAEVFTDFGNWNFIIDRLKDFLLVGIFITLVNAFWILPSLSFIFGNITATNSIGVLGFANWVGSLSQNTSFVNVLRMQGAWDWYIVDSATKLPFYIPYALNYFNNPIFICFSFLIPSLAILSFFLKNVKSNLLYVTFGIMLILGIFLTIGTHQPSGDLFNFFARHIPFFSLFRSPWYIFAPLVGLSIAGLVSIFFNNIYEVFPKKIVQLSGIVFIIGVLFYSYPLLLGRIFRPASANGFFIKFPDYVYQVRDYLAKTKVDGRILSYPDDNIEKFRWGYSGTDSILDLFSDKEIVFTPLNDITSSFAQIVSELYGSLKKDQIDKVNKLAEKLEINQVFYKQDQDSLAPILPKKILDNKIATFGQWGFYSLANTYTSKIRTTNCCLLSYPYRDFGKNLSLVNNDEILVNPDDKLLEIASLSKNGGVIVHANNLQLSDFNETGYSLKLNLKSRDLSRVDFDFNVSKSGTYSPVLEKYGIDSFGIINQNKLLLSIDGKNEVWTINGSDDSYLYFSPIEIMKGEHKITIQLKNKNLIDESNFAKNGDGLVNFANGVFSIFNSSDESVSFNFPVSDFDPYSYYLVGVTYQQIYGSSAQILISQGNKKSVFKNQVENMPTYPDWRDFSFYYNPVQLPSSMTMQLESSPTKDPLGAKVQYKNLSVYKVFNNDLFFKMDLKPAGKLGTVTYKENSPVSYSGKLSGGSGPQVILFNENYSSSWQLSILGNPTAKIFHFTGNSYANTWYVDGVDTNFDFIIKYKSQNLLIIGYIIAGLTVAAGMIYFFLGKKKNGR